jgi:hypothetical protein
MANIVVPFSLYDIEIETSRRGSGFDHLLLINSDSVFILYAVRPSRDLQPTIRNSTIETLSQPHCFTPLIGTSEQGMGLMESCCGMTYHIT